MGDATHNKPQSNNIMNAFQNSGKRQRVHFESSDVTPTPSNTSTNGDISAVSSVIEVPQLQLEGNNFDTESRETVVDTYADRENLKLAYRVDNLKDKQSRYESHVSFLCKCLDNNIIPNGLRVYCEPSIGNRDEDFLEKWHNKLTECSKALINITIEWSKNTIEKTKAEIQTTSDRLKESVPAPTFREIETSLAKNQESRTNELVHRKNRKFYKLKYGDKDREAAVPSNNRTNEIINNRGHRGMGQQERNRGDDNFRSVRPRNDRNTTDRPREDTERYVRNNNNNHSYDQNSRIDRPREDNRRYARNDNNYNQNSDRPREDNRRHARNDNNHNNSDSEHDERVLAAIERRAGNYAGAVKGPRANLEAPIHERLLGKRNSNRSIRNRTDVEDYPSLRQDRPREDRRAERDSKDKEIDSLRKKIREMENERTEKERVVNHYSPNDTSAKNGEGGQAGPSKTNRSPEEMQTYIQEALRVICGFAESFNTQQDPTRTHTDK